MKLKINTSLETMKKGFFKNLKPYQIVCLCIAVVFTLIIVMLGLFVYKVELIILVYFAMFFNVPLGYIGVFRKNGMDFLEYRHKKKIFKNQNGRFLYHNMPDSRKSNIKSVEKKPMLEAFVDKLMKKKRR